MLRTCLSWLSPGRRHSGWEVFQEENAHLLWALIEWRERRFMAMQERLAHITALSVQYSRGLALVGSKAQQGTLSSSALLNSPPWHAWPPYHCCWLPTSPLIISSEASGWLGSWRQRCWAASPPHPQLLPPAVPFGWPEVSALLFRAHTSIP